MCRVLYSRGPLHALQAYGTSNSVIQYRYAMHTEGHVPQFFCMHYGPIILGNSVICSGDRIFQTSKGNKNCFEK